jgi:hypothetical protein
MNDLDPILREAMARVHHPVDLRPSLRDVRRRARRHGRRRMAATAGALACTGVATAALIIRRDSGNASTSMLQDDASTTISPTTTMFLGFPQTTIYLGSTPPPAFTVDSSLVWEALQIASQDPSGSALIPPDLTRNPDETPTPEMFGCTTTQCDAMFNYIVWNAIANRLGFQDVVAMQAFNPGVDFTQLPREGDVLQSALYGIGPDGSVLPTSTTTTTTSPGVTDPCDTADPPTALVVNASHTDGSATWWRDALATNVPYVNFAEPANAIVPEARSRVLALAGSECEALHVAEFTTATEVETATIETLQSLVAVPLPEGTAIVVLVGDDQMSQMTGQTTTTMAPTTYLPG